MWRHEDVFFGAMGGAGGGGKPITTPEEIAERCLEPRTRCVPACPFMHGTAHWMAFSALFTGGAVVIPAEHRLDALALWQLVEREQANFMVIVGDAFARPMLDALDTDAGRALDVSRLRVLLSGGAILSPTLKRELVERLPGVLVVDGYGASETGGQGQSVVVAGGDIPTAPRSASPTTRWCSATISGPRRRASSAGSRAAARSRSATTRTPRRPRRRSRSSTACAGPCPAITRSSTTTARSRCSAAVRCRSTPAARRSTPKRSSRC